MVTINASISGHECKRKARLSFKKNELNAGLILSTILAMNHLNLTPLLAEKGQTFLISDY